MNQESSDSPDDIAQSDKTASELQGLSDAIALTLFQLAEPLPAGTPRQESRMQAIYPGTDHEVIRQMWLIESIDSEVWLDETGELWYITATSPDYTKPINLAIQEEGALVHCKALVLSFMARLTP